MTQDALLAFLGGLVGAGLGAWVTLRVDRLNRERAERHRYSPENRRLYLDFLELCSDRARKVRAQLDAAWEWSQGRKPEAEIPTLGSSYEVERALERIENAVPHDSVARHGSRLLLRMVIQLDEHAYRAGRQPIDPLSDPVWALQWESYLAVVSLVRSASQREVGAAPPISTGRLSRAKRWLEGRRAAEPK